jgi:predicted nucleotidyltransferase/predicted XRE-type DNA-binding protein
MANLRASNRTSADGDTAAAVRTRLAKQIVGSLDRRGLTVREAQALTGTAAADFSRLRTRQLDRFTIDRLLEIAGRLGERVELAVHVRGNVAAVVPKPLAAHLKPLRTLCKRFAVRRLSAFGSVLTEDFNPAASDVDLAVEFGKSRRYTPADQYFGFEAALERLLGRSVDLVELKAMPESRLKRIILRTQVPIFEQAA